MAEVFLNDRQMATFRRLAANVGDHFVDGPGAVCIRQDADREVAIVGKAPAVVVMRPDGEGGPTLAYELDVEGYPSTLTAAEALGADVIQMTPETRRKR